MANLIFIIIAVIFAGVPVIIGIYKLIEAATGDKITFIKGDKRITISSKLGVEDKRKLLEF